MYEIMDKTIDSVKEIMCGLFHLAWCAIALIAFICCWLYSKREYAGYAIVGVIGAGLYGYIMFMLIALAG